MGKHLHAFLLVGCLSLTSTASFAQKPGRRAIVPKSAVAQSQLDLGKLDGNTHTNDFFALKIEFPLGWLVGDHTLEAQLVAITKGGIQTKNPQNQKAMSQAVDRVTPLLGGYKALPGTPQNSNLRIIAENLRTLPQVKDGKDYLEAMLTTIKAVQLPPGFEVSEIKSETVNNVPLDYLETSFNGSRKRAYALVRKGYALLLTIESYDDTDFDTLHKVLTETNLDYKK